MQPSTIPSSWGRRKAPRERRDDGPARHRLRFTNADGATRWVKSLPLTNFAAVYDALLGQLNALKEAELPPAQRARIAEVLREQVVYLHTDLAKRYAGKAQPPEQRESEVAAQAIALWHALWEQYSICLKPLLDGDSDLATIKPALLQRALYVGKELVLVYGVARRLPPPGLWQELHAYYRMAEVQGCAGASVTDPLMPYGVGISCYSTYCHALLLALADPYAMPLKHIELTDRWLQRWARKVFPYSQPRISEGALILIDLRGPHGATLPCCAPPPTDDHIRYAYAGKLATSVRGRLTRLRAGADPIDLQLGNDCTVETCIALLSYLESRWCRQPSPVVAQRPLSLQLCTGGVYSAFFRVGGRSFERQDPRHPYRFRSRQPLSAFDALTDYDRGKEQAEREWPWEHWEGTFGANDAVLARHDPAHYRWMLDQIVVLRDTKDAERAGFVTRVASGNDGGMHVNVTLWPGKPQALTLRPLSTVLVEQHPPIPALLFAANGDEAPFLIVASLTFQPERELRCTDGGAERRYCFKRLLQRGVDFERIAFEAIQ